MKKKLLKIFCAFLAAVMVFSSAGIALAKEKVTPVILIHGVNGSALYENVGTENEKEIKTLGLGEITDILTADGFLAEAIKMLSDEQQFDFDALLTIIHDYVKDNKFNTDEDGNPLPGQGIKDYWETPMSKHRDYWEGGDISELGLIRQICKFHGAKNTYAFNYDWRIDACQTARKLRKFIESVKERTGAKKVILVGCSFGGAILTAYLDQFRAENDVERFVFVNPAINGTDVTRLYAGDIKINKKQVLKYLDGMQGANPGSTQQKIMKYVKILGRDRIEIAAGNLAKISRKKSTTRKIARRVIKPWFGNVAGLYECIPYDVFKDAMNTMSKYGVINRSGKLYKKLKRFHRAQGNLKKNLKYVKRHGAEVAIIANYNEPGIPVTSKANNHMDGLIDTVRASGGATVADYGKTLNRSGKYVSPDKVIDASTCILPNCTWFLKDVQHMQFRIGTDVCKFIARLACGDFKLNIRAVKKKLGYSQFLVADNDQKISNVTA